MFDFAEYIPTDLHPRGWFCLRRGEEGQSRCRKTQHLLGPTTFPRGFQVKLTQREFWVRCRQVFGLTSVSTFVEFLRFTASQLDWPVHVVNFVLVYRCGAVLDLHQVPF